jgi:hypothetical protein
MQDDYYLSRPDNLFHIKYWRVDIQTAVITLSDVAKGYCSWSYKTEWSHA